MTGPATPGTPGTRRRDPARRPRRDWSWLGALLLLALAAVLVDGTRATSVVDPPQRVTSGALVRHVLRACPGQPVPRGVGSHVVAGSLPDPAIGGNGSATAGRPGARGASLHLTRGRLVTPAASAGSAPVLRADGEIAAGLFGFRTDRGPTTLAGAACPEPRATWWFTGAGASLDHTSSLVMSNLDPGPAVVDVRVYGPHGLVNTLGTRGITLAPGSRTRLDLRKVAPQTSELAVQVTASRGRVVASISDAFAARAGAHRGDEWLPDQLAPSRVVRLAGLPARAKKRTLLVANPSQLESVVSVSLAGTSGFFTPTGLGDIQVPPGSVTSVDLSSAVGGKASAVRVQSRVPVTATVRSTTATDSSYAAPVVPLVGPAAAPVLRGVATTVQVTAGRLESRARVRGYDAAGHRMGGARLVVKPRTTTTWKPGPRAAYVVVTPLRGSIYGAVTLSGAGISEVPLVSLPVRIQRPQVLPATG